ncbi:MAG: biosynthetic-type acetolactate synthase large subunit [Planctomycetia bacterium]|nr:biosynthetic-type acetolactate synthase large subunit [Planctomycetia bacterium]
MSGADIVIQTLVNNDVSVIFAYPGGQSMPLHQAMTHFRNKLRVILPRHEQGGGFAAQGYARATGKVGVCMTTSGPGATNIITSIADAKLDSVPIVILTGQVGTHVIGSDGFQETPITEVCRSITKHHYLITDIKDVVRIINEAIYVAATGRPGPVLVDIPKNVQVAQCIPDFDVSMDLPGYCGESREVANDDLDYVVEAIVRSKRPLFFVGGGVISANATDVLKRIVNQTGIPITTSMTGLSAFPRQDSKSLGMIGMHGDPCSNFAVSECDLMIACGVRFSDRVTGKVSEFAKKARLIQFDVDPSEINKVKTANFAIIADLNVALTALEKKLKNVQLNDYSIWHEKINHWKKNYPLRYSEDPTWITAQQTISELSKQTQNRKTIITTGVGQHQLWTAQLYQFQNPRTWLSSCGLGTMGFGLPAAMGAKIAVPDADVIDIDGDGSLQMNIQEMATCYTEKIPVKVVLMNNQHLGNVMQWEDQFFGHNRANTYLGSIDDPETLGNGDGYSPNNRYPDYAMIAKAYGWEALSITKKSELSDAIKTMLDCEKPFLLDVAVPYRQYVLPIIPPGGTISDMIRN